MTDHHGGGAQLTVIWWRDIPAQVVARQGRTTVRAELPARFQQAIDRAAMRAGLEGSAAYLEHWHRRTRACAQDLQSEVDAEVATLIDSYPPARLNDIVKSTSVTSGPSA